MATKEPRFTMSLPKTKSSNATAFQLTDEDLEIMRREAEKRGLSLAKYMTKILTDNTRRTGK